MFRIAELCRRIDVEAKDGQGARRVIKTTQRDSGKLRWINHDSILPFHGFSPVRDFSQFAPQSVGGRFGVLLPSYSFRPSSVVPPIRNIRHVVVSRSPRVKSKGWQPFLAPQPRPSKTQRVPPGPHTENAVDITSRSMVWHAQSAALGVAGAKRTAAFLAPQPRPSRNQGVPPKPPDAKILLIHLSPLIQRSACCGILQ